MATELVVPRAMEPERRVDKGLKSGALGLISSTVIGVASTAPAYSLAATLGFVVVAIGPQAPIVTILAFVPMLLISFAYKELNRADPDCGTTFTWGARAFGPRTGWMGGWAIVAADVLVMASLAQVAGQYVFLLFNTPSIGHNASSGWVLLVGIIWIVLMTYVCYMGIEISANFQKALLGIELTMLAVLSIVALVKVGNGSAPVGHLTPSWSWFNPFAISSPSAFVNGVTLMLFIYWGWDTTVSINEETADPETVPGRAAVLSTEHLHLVDTPLPTPLAYRRRVPDRSRGPRPRRGPDARLLGHPAAVLPRRRAQQVDADARPRKHPHAGRDVRGRPGRGGRLDLAGSCRGGPPRTAATPRASGKDAAR